MSELPESLRRVLAARQPQQATPITGVVTQVNRDGRVYRQRADGSWFEWPTKRRAA